MVTGNTKKSSYISYYFSSTEKGHDGDYQVYIIFYIQEDLKYMEICVMDEEHLYQKNRKNIWNCLPADKEKCKYIRTRLDKRQEFRRTNAKE